MELLVVITIIGILAGLLMPAIQSVRERARTGSCANNLKQVASAIHQYAEVYGRLPPGAVAIPNEPQGRQRWNWAIVILPYLEQDNLYQLYDNNLFNINTETQQTLLENYTFRTKAYVAVYCCPSDPAAAKTGAPGNGPAAPRDWGDINGDGRDDWSSVAFQHGSYKGVSGFSPGDCFWDSTSVCPSKYKNQIPSIKWRGPLHVVGIGNLAPESFADITDGTSNTFLVGEQGGGIAYWGYTYGWFSLSVTTTQARTLLGNYTRCTQIAGTGSTGPCYRGWGSYHNGVVNFALCDGSVRPISLGTVQRDSDNPTKWPPNKTPSIDMTPFAAMGSIAGGETLEYSDTSPPPPP